MMPRQWRFLNTGAGEAAMNMALDEALLLQAEAGAAPPTLRVYSWSQPTLSVGYAQQTRQEVDLEACARQGIGLIRRPTGGRAVLHEQEVTYSVVLPLVLDDGPVTLTEHYRRIGLALEVACRLLGLPVQLARPQVRPSSTRSLPSPACFAALSRYELSVAGKKLVGSAQKRAKHALLQHGSIPLVLDRQRLFQCLRVPEAQRATLVQEAYTIMVAVHEVATAPVPAAAWPAALQEGFGTIFHAAFSAAPLSATECRLAYELYTSKYTTASWNLEGAGVWRQRQLAGTPL